jgi:carboxypeptidase Taq
VQAWVSARKESDFSKFAPFLQQWVDVNKQKAAAIDPSLPPYDVLLDDYEKGMTSARLDEIFAEVGHRGQEAAAQTKRLPCRQITS